MAFALSGRECKTSGGVYVVDMTSPGVVTQVVDSTGRVSRQEGIVAVAPSRSTYLLSSENKTYCVLRRVDGQDHLVQELDPAHSPAQYAAARAFMEWVRDADQEKTRPLGESLWTSPCSSYVGMRDVGSGHWVLLQGDQPCCYILYGEEFLQGKRGLLLVGPVQGAARGVERVACRVMERLRLTQASCQVRNRANSVVREGDPQAYAALDRLQQVIAQLHFDIKKTHDVFCYTEQSLPYGLCYQNKQLHLLKQEDFNASQVRYVVYSELSAPQIRERQLSTKWPHDLPFWKESRENKVWAPPLHLFSPQARQEIFREIYTWFATMPTGSVRTSLLLQALDCSVNLSRRDQEHVAFEFVQQGCHVSPLQVVISSTGEVYSNDLQDPLHRFDLLKDNCAALFLIDALALTPGAARIVALETGVSPLKSGTLLAAWLQSAPLQAKDWKQSIVAAGYWLSSLFSTENAVDPLPKELFPLSLYESMRQLLHGAHQRSLQLRDPLGALDDKGFLSEPGVLSSIGQHGVAPVQYTTLFFNPTICSREEVYFLCCQEDGDRLTLQVNRRGERQHANTMVTVTLQKNQPTLEIQILPKDPFAAVLCRRPEWQGADQIRLQVTDDHRLELFKGSKRVDGRVDWTKRDNLVEAEGIGAHYIALLWRMQALLHHPNTFSSPELHEIIPFEPSTIASQELTASPSNDSLSDEVVPLPAAPLEIWEADPRYLQLLVDHEQNTRTQEPLLLQQLAASAARKARR